MTFNPVLLFLLCVAFFTGCTPPPQPLVFVEEVAINVDQVANNNTAVAVDLLIVYDDALVATLSKLSANAYFAQKKQILRDNPAQIDLYNWELVPGQHIPPTPVYITRPLPRGGIVFANYLTPGDHRIRLGPEPSFKIMLGKDDVSVTPPDKH
jgi:type VI secretion system protein